MKVFILQKAHNLIIEVHIGKSVNKSKSSTLVRKTVIDMELFLSAYISYLVIIDPVGVSLIFTGLTRGKKKNTLKEWPTDLFSYLYV